MKHEDMSVEDNTIGRFMPPSSLQKNLVCM